jgi:hypothetical protein
MQKVTGSSPVSPTNHRIMIHRRPPFTDPRWTMTTALTDRMTTRFVWPPRLNTSAGCETLIRMPPRVSNGLEGA